MKWTISRKIFVLVFAVITITAGSMLGSTTYILSQWFAEDAATSITALSKILGKITADMERKMLEQATLITRDTTFIAAVEAKDTNAVKKLAVELARALPADLLTITDEKGVVLGRGHSDRVGDSIMNQTAVQRALRGEHSSGVVSGTEAPYTLRAVEAIRKDGKIIGTVGIGVSLIKESFVDDLKSNLGAEVTIFKGDTRVMTTVTSGTGRAIGTRMTLPVVLDSVMQQGKMYFVQNTLFNKPYQSAYWPMKDPEGKIVGMWFIGKPLEHSVNARDNIMITTLLAALALLPILGLGAWFIIRTISQPIVITTEYAAAVARGELDKVLQVNAQDEVGDLAAALVTMVSALKRQIEEVRLQTETAAQETCRAQAATREAQEARHLAEQERRRGVLYAAGELEGIVTRLSSTSKHLSTQIMQAQRSAENQNRRSAETATAMDEMSATVLEVARSAGQANDQAENTRQRAFSGEELVGRVVSAINRVDSVTQEIQKNMQELNAQAESIGGVMNVISDIADQTNLLALNAAIEAARAGEAGRGFAVVADEVRKLAEKTMHATSEVGSSIKGIQAATASNMVRVTEAAHNATQATDLASTSGGALREIVQLAAASSSLIASIATAAEQQSSTAEEINRAIDDINRIATTTASSMEESTTAVSGISHLTQEMNALLAKLRADGAA